MIPWTPIIILTLILVSTRADALRDQHFDPDRRTRWRQPIAWLGTDPWHLAKWVEFYPPRIALLWFIFGSPWAGWIEAGLWAGMALLAWTIWRWGSPWPSFWARLFKRGQ